jgi:hypothetical protein
MLKLPAVPSVAEPVRIVIIPELPFVTVFPDVKDREPETPLPPASAVRMLNAPLDVARPYPVMREIDPPVILVLWPEDTATRPPAEILPLPTTMLMLPAAPSVADPVRKVIMPLLPAEVTPLVIEIEPEVPALPAFAVRTLKTPLDLARP